MNTDQLFNFLSMEQHRQKTGIVLIASENYVSTDIQEMVGSVLMNKYIEGNVGARYYSGCEFIDKIEAETIDRFKKLFGAAHVNVQPHSGSIANFSVYFALLQPGDTILSMKLSDGGHLTHGHKVSMSGSLYNIVSYGVDGVTELIDYDQMRQLAQRHKPQLIIAGTSSYSRTIDFEKISKIARDCGAYFLADIAHIAGFVAVGLHPSPIGLADVVTMTTHKTFRGPRGGVIFCTAQLATKIDRAVMPGIQGGAFAHEIAAKGLACRQVSQPEFKLYLQRVLDCAKIMAQAFIKLGYKVISGGTDTHLFLVDIRPLGLTGKQAEQILESVGIFVNRNAIPFDTLSPLQGGGIRIGTAAIVTRGATHTDCEEIVEIIHAVLGDQIAGKNLSVYPARVQQITDRWK